jgi:hypothetical protein
MELLKDIKELQKCNIFYKSGNGKTYNLGTLTKAFVFDKMVYGYIFDLNKEVYEHLYKIDKNFYPDIIPGVDVEEWGYYQAFSRLPFFISSRVADPRTGNIDMYLKRFNMKYYDAFTMFLRNKGRSLDNLYVEEIPVQ